MEKKKKPSKRMSLQGLSVVVLILGAVSVLSTGFSSWLLIAEAKEQTIFNFDIATTIDASSFFVVGEIDMPKKIGPEGFVDKDHIIVKDFDLKIPLEIKFNDGLSEYVQENTFTINVSLINLGSFTNFFNFNKSIDANAANRMEVNFSANSQQIYSSDFNKTANEIKTSFTISPSDHQGSDAIWRSELSYKFDFNTDFDFLTYSKKTESQNLNLKVLIGVDI